MMQNKLLHKIAIAVLMFVIPVINQAQIINLGTAANFELFSGVGAVGNTGISQVTGNVGTNSGAITGFGNVNGQMHAPDLVTGQCAADLLIAYGQLSTAVPTFFPSTLLGNGQTLNAGVYAIAGLTTLNLTLNLDAQNNPNAVFIFQISSPFSANANARVVLKNGAKACNVFWKVEGTIILAANVSMKGNLIANNAAITLSTGDTLEGRALSTGGAVNVTGVLAYTPIGCGSPTLTGPAAADLGSTCAYSLFSTDGAVSNAGITHLGGDVGTNVGLTTGFNPLFVTGMIHPIPDGSTAAAAADLLNAFTYLNTLPFDIELLYPAQFGRNLVLTPHVYLMNGATTFTDTLYLNAQGNANAVFVIQINGAIITSTFSKVVLINGTQSENVFWAVNGAVSINDFSIFEGNIISNNGAIDITTGVVLNGRAMTTTGALQTAAITVNVPSCLNSVPTVITTQPANKTVCSGSSVSFIVAATGTGLTYQWRRGNVNLVNSASISGVTNDTLVFNPTSTSDAALNYNVIISSPSEPNDTSNNASLTVNTAPVITLAPSNQTASSGGTVTFVVNATGAGLTYQWRKGLVNLINSASISGVTNDTLVISNVTALDAAVNYNVVISGTCSPVATSANVSLTISDAPNITAQASNQTVCEGNSVSFTVVATGTGLTYQWRKGLVNVVNSATISGVTTATLTINPANVSDAAANYNVVVTGATAPSATSNNVSLTINTSPVITTSPSNQTASSGGTVSFTVVATGAGLTYQWRKGLVNVVNSASVSGATTATLTINPVAIGDVAANYNVVVSGTCSPAATSANVSLSVSDAPNITAQASNQTVCEGNSVSFTVVATGTSLTFQWRKGLVNLVNSASITGATTATLTINPANVSDAAANYNVVVTGATAPAATSNNVSLTVNTAPIITTAPSNQTASSGGTVSFTVVATGTGLTYQWRKGLVNVVNSASITGATTAILTINPVTVLDASANYNVVVTGTCSPAATSANVSLTVSDAPAITVQASNQTVCEGNSVSFTVVATGTSLTYQWRKGLVNLVNSATITGATTATLTINPANLSDAAANYNVVVTGATAPAATSNNVSLTVNTSPVITTAPSNQTTSTGGSISFAVTAIGTNLTYQWRNGLVNLVNSASVSGATTATLTINPVAIGDVAANYNVVVSGTCSPAATSANVSLTVSDAPVITVQASNQTVCEGNSVSFIVVATGTGLTYQWRKGLVNIVNSATITGATTATLTINPANVSDAAANYNVVVTGATAPAATSNNVSLTVNTSPVITTQASNQTICAGSNTSFTVAATGTGLTYQWRNGIINVVNNAIISGATTATLTFTNATVGNSSINYNVVVSGTCSPSVTSNNATLLVNPIPTITAVSNQVICNGANTSAINFVGTPATSTFNWTNSNTSTGLAASGSGNIASFVASNTTNAAVTSTITVTPTANTCVGSNLVFTMQVNPTIATPSISSNSAVCVGSTINLSTAFVAGATYNWSGPNAFASTLQNPNITNATTAMAGTYSLSINNATTCISNVATTNVIVNTIPVVTASSNAPICVGTDLNLSAQSTATGTYAWTGVNGFTSTLQNPTIASTTIVASGNYNVTITSNGCTSASVSFAVVINPCNATDLSIVKTASSMAPVIGQTAVFTLVATNNGPDNATGIVVSDMLQSGYTFESANTATGSYNSDSGLWTIGALSNGSTATLTITATINTSGNYVNTATISGSEIDANTANDTSSIQPIPVNFNIPEGFSPNGDNINDVFFIRGLELYPNNTMTIFNRWGEKVYEAAPYKNNWDGSCETGVTVGSNELPTGTYFYVFFMGNNTKALKGTIYLNR